MRVSQPRGEVLFEMAMESEDRVSDAVRVIERGGGHPHHEAMAAVMARILASATPPGPGSASKIQERKRKGGGKRIEQNIKRKRRKMKNGNMETERSSDHSSSSDEVSGSDSGSTWVHSAGPPPPVTDVVLQCHRSPLDWDVEGERQLQRMATRGVVQLFNAVSKQQKIIEKKAKEAGASERKKAKVLKSIDKGSFIDMLKTAGAGDSERTNRTARTTISSSSLAESSGGQPGGGEVEQPDWDVLKDGYFTKKGAAATSSSMLDWEEEEEGEGDSSSLEDSSSHLHEL